MFPYDDHISDYLKFEFIDSNNAVQETIQFTNYEIPDGINETENIAISSLDSRAGDAYQSRTTTPRAFSFTIRTAKLITWNKLLKFFQQRRLDHRVKVTMPYYKIYQPVTEDIQDLPIILNSVAVDAPARYRNEIAGAGLEVDARVPFTIKETATTLTIPTSTQIITAGGTGNTRILIAGSN